MSWPPKLAAWKLQKDHREALKTVKKAFMHVSLVIFIIIIMHEELNTIEIHKTTVLFLQYQKPISLSFCLNVLEYDLNSLVNLV